MRESIEVSGMLGAMMKTITKIMIIEVKMGKENDELIILIFVNWTYIC